MTEAPFRFRVADLSARRETPFDLRMDTPQQAKLAADLGIDALRKLRFSGRLVPDGRRDWRLEAILGATVVQPCVVTLAPVTTRIDEPVKRHYLADAPPVPSDADEVEMPEDDTQEPLPAVIDVMTVMIEALTLALPLYPRAAGAELGTLVAVPPGATPLEDNRVHPFAALASLRKDGTADPQAIQKADPATDTGTDTGTDFASAPETAPDTDKDPV